MWLLELTRRENLENMRWELLEKREAIRSIRTGAIKTRLQRHATEAGQVIVKLNQAIAALEAEISLEAPHEKSR